MTALTDRDDRWGSLRALIVQLGTAVSRDDFLESALETLVEAIGADRGLILLTDGVGATTTIQARGRGGPLRPDEQAEISRTLIREVWSQRRAVMFEPIADAPHSMMALGIVCALAAPMPATLAGDDDLPPRGVLYVDVRDPLIDIGAPALELLEVAAALLSLVLGQREERARVEEDLRAQGAREGRAPVTPSLDELLRFPSLAPMRAEVAAAVASELPVLLLGESGTGKTLLARAIAEASGRLPLVRAMLGAADDLNTITSELFGHEKGAFSGALVRRTGLCAFADGGTLILDEVLNLPPHAQQLLLDFTQFGTYRPLGHAEAEPRRARVRLIAATNGDLEAAVRARTFREDLFYRLSGFTIVLPPLRDRRADIPELAEGFLRRSDPERPWTLTVAARRSLLSHELGWPGNLRELELVIQRARDRVLAVDRDATAIDAAQLQRGEARPAAPTSGAELADGWRDLLADRARLDDRERALLRRALDKHGGVTQRAAAELGLGRTSLLSRINTLKLKV